MHPFSEGCQQNSDIGAIGYTVCILLYVYTVTLQCHAICMQVGQILHS